MKKFKYIALASVVALGVSSCGDFGDLNIDPEHLNEANVPTAMLFTNAEHQALGSDWDMWRTGCIYSAQFTQQLTSIDWWDSYGRYNYSDGYSASFWDTFNGDRGALRDVTTCVDKWKGNDKLKIDWNIARVMRVYAFGKMTDLYGDIPYSQAGRPDQFSYPVYDSQKDIYTDMLKELDEAQANLASGTADMGAHDVYFAGNAAKWKKFANSLMLRLAMRLVKVDEATAKKYAAKAFANGVITDYADNVKLDHPGASPSDDSAEPFAKINAKEDREFFLSKTFVDMLKDSQDPRISLIATVAATNGIKSVEKDLSAEDYGDMTPEKQEGLLSGGYSLNPTSPYAMAKVDPRFKKDDAHIIDHVVKDGKSTPVYWYDRYTNYFSIPNRYTYNDPTAPTFVVTAAQTNFLLAEAVVRGYISGDAKKFYEDGVKAAFLQFKQFPNAGKIYQQYLDGKVDAYLAANPYNAAKALEQINTQYYITTFGDPHEVFTNWRRSGFPVLTPNAMAKEDGQCATKDGSIPRRFIYPSKESQVNKANYDAAIARQGKDRFDTRVWWDK
ncbi:SusD/RagB family nutrient-binding outer membrane lipoprotein [Prevotella sp. S7 MS 2]|uniref:SusD/RagB family nutrient-binding outer membrane lipoprotein n=1 Tax=Prevotella sp. S7 MS 2 TaxID=1287488 RepID=UPI00051362A7|nr:SusD/RagB family nutrient-binding outer membrane lipoprotein [Prevotella sp. S7 MS 2]KGI60164.1 hypothetical protein HMPREF0671_07585 [Prevotella sp. S7 MS 2]